MNYGDRSESRKLLPADLLATFAAKQVNRLAERDPANMRDTRSKGVRSEIHVGVDNANLAGHDLEKPAGRLNSAKTSPFVANHYTLGQSCSILLLNVL